MFNKLYQKLYHKYNDTEETIEIKEYTNKIKEEFKDKDITIHVFNNNSVNKSDIKLKDIYKAYKNNKETIKRGISGKILGNYIIKTKKIEIYLNNIIQKFKEEKQKNPKINIIKRSITKLRNTIYHELRHKEIVENKINNNDLATIMYIIESIIITKKEYYKKHDSIYYEIDANEYAINKTIEHYIENPNDIYDLEYINDLFKEYNSNKSKYDFDKTFTRFNFITTLPHNKLLKTHKNLYKKLACLPLLKWYQVFYHENGNLKSFEDIINNKELSNIDEEFTNLVFTSRYFNNLIELKELSKYHQEILLNHFIKRLNIEKNKVEIALKEINPNIYKTEDLFRFRKNILFYDSKIKELTNLLNVENKYHQKEIIKNIDNETIDREYSYCFQGKPIITYHYEYDKKIDKYYLDYKNKRILIPEKYYKNKVKKIKKLTK